MIHTLIALCQVSAAHIWCVAPAGPADIPGNWAAILFSLFYIISQFSEHLFQGNQWREDGLGVTKLIRHASRPCAQSIIAYRFLFHQYFIVVLLIVCLISTMIFRRLSLILSMIIDVLSLRLWVAYQYAILIRCAFTVCYVFVWIWYCSKWWGHADIASIPASCSCFF